MKLLSHEEVRVLGSILEKQYTTPAYYPMTINSITNACNQKSSRNPVVSFDESQVEDIISELREKQLTGIVTSSDFRVPKYTQLFGRHYNLSIQEVAVLCVLFLRGAQTVGEIRSRTSRIYNFNNLSEVHETFDKLMNREDAPFIIKLPKNSGREHRYTHLFCGEPEITVQDEPIKKESLETKVNQLEDEVQKLKDEIATIKNEFNQFRKELE
ncbi:MAG: DUF480 domain-containing protein [Melioribacteraceae bacterium]|nr:DUF480 domain-containing protein [Melioribacteraceae bacterium]